MSDNNGAIAAALLGVAVAAEEIEVENTENSNNDFLTGNEDILSDNELLSNNDYQSNNDFLSGNDDIASNNDIASHNNTDYLSNNDYQSNNDFLSGNDDIASNNDIASHNNTDYQSNNDFLSENDDVLSNNDILSNNDTDYQSNNDTDFLSGNDDIASNNDIASHNTTDVSLEDVAFGGSVNRLDLDLDISDSFNVDVADSDWIDLDGVTAGPITVLNAGGHIFSNTEINELTQTQTNTFGPVTITDGGWGADDTEATFDSATDGADGNASVSTINDSINLEISLGAHIQQNVVTFNVVGGDGDLDVSEA